MRTVKGYRLLIFDWDGTIEDSIASLTQSIGQVLGLAGLDVPPVADIRNVIGLSFVECLAQLYPDADAFELARKCERVSRSLSAQPEAPLIAGASQSLASLHGSGFWLAVATGKTRPALDRSMHRFALTEWFLSSRTADDARSKPHPEMIESLLDELGVRADEALMIGDSLYDMAMAEAAGVGAVAVASGVHSVDTLHAAGNVLTVLPGIADLPTFLEQE